ncbi:MAG: hypothetical protein WC939_02635 [Acholeplasmataceae bacterium]|jgi:hypothetical protein
MAGLEGIGDKFIVIKKDDLKYLDKYTGAALDLALAVINENRKAEGKKFNYYLVVNADESYAGQVIDLMKTHGHWG